ncbi:MAG TPA: hypothetical protein VKY15_02885 [Acidimicrobiales bacterium]|nr:hypothetical protein [Acidimicrobiales bacterium]
MARTSISRKVARAAATGGDRRLGRGRRPLGWYGVLTLIVVLGSASVAYSRYENTHPRQAPSATPPTVKDTWRVAYAVDICGTILPNLPQPAKLTGISTRGDGLIWVEPKLDRNPSLDTGHRAVLGRFVASTPGLVLSSTQLGYPGRPTMTNGDKCGASPGRVRVRVWNSLVDTTGHVVSGDPNQVRLEDGQLITMAFLPPGTDIPQPPSRTNLSKPLSSTTTTAPGAPAPAPAAPSARYPATTAK